MVPGNEISRVIKEQVLVAGNDEVETILLCEYLRQEGYGVLGPCSCKEVKAHFFDHEYAFLFVYIRRKHHVD